MKPTANPRYEHLRRHCRLRNELGCTYCGILKNQCDRARQPRPDRYKNRRRG